MCQNDADSCYQSEQHLVVLNLQTTNEQLDKVGVLHEVLYYVFVSFLDEIGESYQRRYFCLGTTKSSSTDEFAYDAHTADLLHEC